MPQVRGVSVKRATISRTLTFFDAQPAPAKLLHETRVDEVTWKRMALSDGIVSLAGRCPCGTLLLTQGRVFPTALRCAVCRTWRRLP